MFSFSGFFFPLKLPNLKIKLSLLFLTHVMGRTPEGLCANPQEGEQRRVPYDLHAPCYLLKEEIPGSMFSPSSRDSLLQFFSLPTESKGRQNIIIWREDETITRSAARGGAAYWCHDFTHPPYLARHYTSLKSSLKNYRSFIDLSEATSR